MPLQFVVHHCYFRLDCFNQVKVADFGLAEDVYTCTYFQLKTNEESKMPLKWMALESIQLGIFSEKSDVVSLTIWHAQYVISW